MNKSKLFPRMVKRPTMITLISGDQNKLDMIKNGLIITRYNHEEKLDVADVLKVHKKQKLHKNISSISLVNFFLGKKNGTVYHNIDGPSVITYYKYTNVTHLKYHVQGYEVENTRDFCYLCGMDDMDTVSHILKYGDKLPIYIDGDPFGLKMK